MPAGSARPPRRLTAVPVPSHERYLGDLQQLAADRLLLAAVYDSLAAHGDSLLAEQLSFFIIRQQQSVSTLRQEGRDHVIEMQAAHLHGKSELLRRAHGLVKNMQLMHTQLQAFQITDPLWQ